MAHIRRSQLQPATIAALALLTLTSFAAGMVGFVSPGYAVATKAQQNDPTLENRRLAWALWQRNADDVKAALKAGADPNARFPAWQYEDFQGINPPGPTATAAFSKFDSFWCSSIPVIMCVQNSYYVPILKDAGADINARDSNGDTPLLFMARGGLASLRWSDFSYQSDMIEGLLQAGADVYARDKDGNTVLHVLAFTFDPSRQSTVDDLATALRLLVGYGADVSAKNNAGQTVLQALTARFADGLAPADRRKVLAVLKRGLATRPAHTPPTHAAPPDAAPPPIIGPGDGADRKQAETRTLAWAVCHDNLDAARAALQAGADPNARFTPPQYFRFQKDDPPPDPAAAPAPETDGREPLSLIFAAGPATVKVLVDAGADVDTRDAAGETPLLFYAADRELALVQGSDIGDQRSCAVDMLAALLDAGADPNARDKDGDTPLHLIHNCLRNDGSGRDNPDEVEDGIRLLARRGADVNAKNNAGQTVLQATESSWGEGYTYGQAINRTLIRLGAKSPHPPRAARNKGTKP